VVPLLHETPMFGGIQGVGKTATPEDKVLKLRQEQHRRAIEYERQQQEQAKKRQELREISRRAARRAPPVEQKEEEAKHAVSKNKSTVSKKSVSTTSGKNVKIRVKDGPRGVLRDFVCDRKLVIQEMKYFRRFFHGKERSEISVQCDVRIFERLMNFVQAETKDCFELECSNAVSILVASEFLGMDALVTKTIAFIANNIGEILSLPMDLGCINDEMVARIAIETTLEALSSIEDSRGKLGEKVFQERTEQILAGKSSEFRMCAFCKNIFWSDLSHCRFAPPVVGCRGKLRQVHMPVQDWDVVNDFLHSEKLKKDFKWSCVFWKLWACMQDFDCSQCEQSFDGLRIDLCSGKPRYDSFFGDAGCESLVQHEPKGKEGRVWGLVLKHFKGLKRGKVPIVNPLMPLTTETRNPLGEKENDSNWALESQRDEDALSMRNLSIKLQSMREKNKES